MPDSPGGLDSRSRAGFAALSRCFLAAARSVEGPNVVAGSVEPYVYGGLGTNIPDFNRIMSADAETLPTDEVIKTVIGRLARYAAMSWWIPPGRFQAELETRLGHHGLAVNPADAVAPCMVIDLAELPDDAPQAGLAIEVATTGGAAVQAAEVSAAAFEMDPASAAEISRIFRAVGERRDSASRYFIATFDGWPVAAALATMDGDAVGIYNVGTVPEARGRGFGRAVTLAALEDGRRRGASIGVLEASPMGRPVYARLGFREIGETRVLARRSA